MSAAVASANQEAAQSDVTVGGALREQHALIITTQTASGTRLTAALLVTLRRFLLLDAEELQENNQETSG